MKSDYRIENVINFIAMIDNKAANGGDKWDTRVMEKNLLVTSLFMELIPLAGICIGKERIIAIICCSLLLISCIFIHGLSILLDTQVRKNKRTIILVYRICGSLVVIFNISLPLLCGIILIGGTMAEVIRSALLIAILVIASIPVGVIRVSRCVKNNNFEQASNDLKQPPYLIAMVIASIFIHSLSESGRTFVVTVFLCLLVLYSLYVSVIPNCMRLYYVKKYGLEDEIPMIFEIKKDPVVNIDER